MKPRRLVLSVGLLALLCGVSGSLAKAQCPPFDANRVMELAWGFNAAVYGACAANANGNCPGGPADTQNPKLTAQQLQNIRSTIQTAFQSAPTHLQNELCRLDRIWLDTDPNSPNSFAWGMMDRSQNNRKHIGISATVFSDMFVQQQPYALLETKIVLGVNDAGGLLTPPQPSNLPRSSQAWLDAVSHTANPDTPTITTLAVLAHEMAHIIWWNEDIANVICPPTNQHFYEFTWKPINNPHGFHQFGAERNQRLYEHFNKGNMIAALRSGNTALLGQEMQAIYTDGNWMNLFAFTDADEDFIETYKFWSLGRAGLNLLLIKFIVPSLGTSPMSFTIYPDNFLGDPGSSLEQKQLWMQAFVQGNCH